MKDIEKLTKVLGEIGIDFYVYTPEDAAKFKKPERKHTEVVITNHKREINDRYYKLNFDENGKYFESFDSHL